MKFTRKNGELRINLTFWEKIWGLHGNFTIPESNVLSITEGIPQSGWRDIKFPGTFFPGIIKAGTYLTPRGKEYWYWVKSRTKVYTVELKDLSYKRLIISTN
jgi:hypothetical protein